MNRRIVEYDWYSPHALRGEVARLRIYVFLSYKILLLLLLYYYYDTGTAFTFTSSLFKF